MKPLHRTPNTIKSLTFKLSLAPGVDIADLRNRRYRLTVPFNGLVFDNHSAVPAWFYAVFPPQLGSGAVPIPAGIRLVNSHTVMAGADSDDPCQAIVSRLVLDIELLEEAAAFADLPLVVKGYSVATNAPASFSLPAFTPSVDAPFVASDAEGGAIAAGIAVEELGMQQGDANTLQGEDGNYYLDRTNHTGSQPIESVSGLEDALDGKAAVSHTHSISNVTDLADALDDLAQATVPPGGSTGQVLAKNSGTHYDVDWVTPASGGSGTEELDDLSDVALTSPGNGQVLKFNGSAWVNADESTGGGDADTLQGEDGDHYLSRTNHTGNQAISTVSGLQSALDGKAASSHTHDNRYYTESEVDAALAGKANSSHSHSIGNVTGLQTALDDLDAAAIPAGGSSGQVLAKASGTDLDVEWVSPAGGGAEDLGDLGDVALSSPTNGQVLKFNGSAWANASEAGDEFEVVCVSVTDEGLPLTTGANKVTFRMPFALTLSSVRASLTTASSSGNPVFDINENGSSILSTKLSIDASEKTSTTAASAAVISDANLADDAEITIDIDTAGTGAAGAKIYLMGTRA